MKTEFELDVSNVYIEKATAKIIGTKPNHVPYVSISITRRGFRGPDKTLSTSVNWRDTAIFIKDKDLERFAVNILKAIKSRRLIK